VADDDRPAAQRGTRFGRRAFLGGSAARGAAALAAAGCTPDGVRRPAGSGRRVPFLGPRQPGVDTPAAHFGLLAAFNLVRQDDRFGLADRRPKELVRMPYLANDRLDPAQTHGDLLLALSADQPDTLLHALRQLMRRTRDNLVLHWMLDGYNRPDARPQPGRTGNRNLLGFKDGTANLDIGDKRLMDELIWVGPDDGEPAWAVGGSYQAVRIIRMFVEFWDRTPLNEQQKIIGRDKASGVPLGQDRETDDPGYGDDPAGRRVPLDAHIRMANPRTPETAGSRILRRGFNFSAASTAPGGSTRAWPSSATRRA
jgi:deferrochelatase/peroxidase EfeB